MAQQTERIAGRFRITRELGQGAAATVYAVLDERLGVERALKRLSPTMTRYARMRARLVSEARAMARLSHPNVVNVYDVFIDNDDACIVMELVEGGSLVGLLEQHGPLPPVRAVQLMIQILAALQHAHEAGIIHRDIKPHNVLLDLSSNARVTDFGVARFLDEDESLTRTGVTMGTWAFMAPEQRADAKSVDHRADIYSAGATLFAILTATTPKDLFAIDLDPALISDIPGPLAPIIQKATRYHREDRYRSAAEMAEALRGAVASLDAEATILPEDEAEPFRAPTRPPLAAAVEVLSTGSETLPDLKDQISDISPADDERYAPPPPLPYRRSTNIAQLIGVAALVLLAFSAWPTVRGLIGEVVSPAAADLSTPATVEPALEDAAPAPAPPEPPLLTSVQPAAARPITVVQYVKPSPPPPPAPEPEPEALEETAPVLVPEEVTVEEADIHAPVPPLEEVVGEVLEAPSRIVPSVDGPSRIEAPAADSGDDEG